MSGLKSLARETAIYGLSSIVGRFLNYLLVPLYTAKMSVASGGYGVITNVYAMTALMLVILTYGMETGFFRFVNRGDRDPLVAYGTTLTSVGTSSLAFIVLCLALLHPLASWLGYGEHPEYIGMMAVVVALDAFMCIPFAWLRYKQRPLKFAAVKMLFIIPNIGLNLFFYLGCPWLMEHAPATVSWFYDPAYGVGYAFVANFICTSCQLLFLLPEVAGFRWRFDRRLWREMMHYSLPILALGVVGILNQTVDKIIYPHLLSDRGEAESQLAVYGAVSKVAMVMAMFTQAFRFAYEPFVFGKSRERDNRATYAEAMKFFVIFGLLAYLAVMCYIDLLKFIIAPDYWEGLKCVPVVMAAELFVGIYFNLSFWYKLIDQTQWGAYFSVIGLVIVLVLNVALVPRFGYMASAWASLTGYAVITLLSYVIGQRRYPIAYDIKSIVRYMSLAAVLLVVRRLAATGILWADTLVGTLLLAVFVAYVVRHDLPLSALPVVGRFFKK